MDIDNKGRPLSVDGSCTTFVLSSLDRKHNMQEQKDTTGHATKYSSGQEHLVDETTHQLEVNAYRSVLRVFSARKTLSWETELLLADLRVHLHITSEEHLFELEKLNLSFEKLK